MIGMLSKIMSITDPDIVEGISPKIELKTGCSVDLSPFAWLQKTFIIAGC
jgi:hypothetical protein